LTRRAGEIHQRIPSLYFDGSEPLAVLTFLCQLKVVFDESGITEAIWSRLLFDFVRGKASRMLESSRASVDRTINSYPGLVQHLHKVYATESAMMRAQAAFYQMMQHPGEDVPLFASRLQEQAGLLDTLYTAEELEGKFVQGLAPGVGDFLAAVGSSHKDESFMALVARTADLAQGRNLHRAALCWETIYFLQQTDVVSCTANSWWSFSVASYHRAR
jgi:Retrotransposon gag protein